MALITNMLSSFDVSKSSALGPARYGIECIGRISDGSKKNLCFTVDKCPIYLSYFLAKGSSTAMN